MRLASSPETLAEYSEQEFSVALHHIFIGHEIHVSGTARLQLQN